MKSWRKRVYHQAEGRRWKSKSWLRLRRKVFKRDEYQCKMCKNFYGEDDLFLTAHHVIPRKKGGKNQMRNLITLCPKCHDKAELLELDKKGILKHKSINVEKETTVANKGDWKKWVYGGYRRP